MRKTRKCYHYFIGASVLFGIMFLWVFMRLQSSVNNVLINLKYTFLIGFVVSISITIVIKNILDDLEWQLYDLKWKTDSLNKKALECEDK